MSRLRDYHKQLSLIIKQRRSIINIQTDDCQAEVERVKEIFKEQNIPLELFKKEDINIWIPDGSGLRRLYGGQYQGNSLCDSLRMLPIRPKETFKSILIIRNLHYYFDSQSDSIPQITSLLERFYFANEKRQTCDRSIVIIISPKFDIPLEIKGRINSIIPPFPDEQDIEEELGLCNIMDASNYLNKGYCPKGKPYKFAKQFFVSYEDNKGKLINALKGLRISEIKSILSYGKTPYLICGFDIKTFKEKKKQLVQDSGLLKVEDVPEKYEEFVGDIEGLKIYMKTERSVIENRAYYNERMPLPKGILLVGPPGCGKSESSKAIASILDLPLYSMDMGRLLGGLMGQSEHNFERALSIAEAAQPCVLRIDEIEKAFAGSGESENEQTMTHIVGHFLTWMQERKSLVYLVATANNLNSLRPEFLRKGRWDEIFYLTYPSADGMKKIIESCLKKYGLRMEDGQEDSGEIECDENGNEVRLSLIGGKTKQLIDTFYNVEDPVMVSGAEIVDIIDQIYKSQFVYFQKVEKSKLIAASNAKVLSVELFEKRLSHISKKQRDAKINKAIDQDVLDIEIKQILSNKSNDKELKNAIKEIIETKYNEEEIKRMIESELDSLEINSILSGNIDKFNRGKIEVILERKYNRTKFIQEDLRELTINMLMQEERLGDEKKNALKAKLKNKYMDNQNEEYFKAQGYRSASAIDNTTGMFSIFLEQYNNEVK